MEEKNMSDVLSYYNGFLDSTNNPRDENGVVLFESNTGDLKPVMIDGKKLILPTREFQNKPDWSQFVAFHPLSESIARGESEVLVKARTLISLRLFFKYIELSETLLMLAVNSDAQGKLTPTQMKFLEGLGDADEKTVENFSKIVAKAKAVFDGGENRCLISLFLKRGGSQNGTKYARLCVASFPYYEALLKIEDEPADKRQVFGVSLRAKDIKVLKRLHETILPGSDDGVYSIGTNSQTAPYWGALMMTYTNILNQFNSVIKPFSKVVKSLKVVNTDWDVGDELQQFRAQIPPMPYNEGADATAAPETPATTPVAQTQQQAVPQPQPQALTQQPVQVQQQPAYNPPAPVHPTPAPVNHSKASTSAGISFGDAISKSPVAMAVPQMYPQMQMMQPQMQMYPQMQMPMQLPMPPVAGQQMYPQQMMLPHGHLPMPAVQGQPQQQQPQQMYQQPYPQQQQMMQPMMYPQQMPGMQQMYPQQQMMQPQMMMPQGMFQFQR
jgi:hypothetical protein